MGLPCPRQDERLAEIEEFRAMAHRQIDKWVDELARRVQRGEAPSLRQITEDFRRGRQDMARWWLKGAVRLFHPELAEQEWATCPCCARPVRRKRLDAKGISTLEGRFTLERPYFYCRRCRHGFHPLDEALELTARFHHVDVAEKLLELAARMPYEEAVEVFESLTGFRVGEDFAHEILNEVGAVATLEEVTPTAEEMAERIDALTQEGEEAPILVVAGDGAHLPTRPKAGRRHKRGPGRYREAKGFRLYLVGRQDRIVHLASWHQIQDAEAFRTDLALVAERVPQERVRIALLADGAEWLWEAMTECFPQGRPILDYYHVAEHVYAVGRALYGEGVRAREWGEALLSTIYLGKIPTALARLRRARARTPEAREAVRKLVRYLWKHRKKLRYEASRGEGYPIGSGGIESAHKFIAHIRMKRSGAWWVEGYGNHMLRIRCALYNGTLGRVFRNYHKQRILRVDRP